MSGENADDTTDDLPPLLTSGVPCALSACHQKARFAQAKEYTIEASINSFVDVTALPFGDISLSSSCIIGREAVLRGDLAKISLGAFVAIGNKTLIKPPYRMVLGARQAAEACPVSIGDYTQFGSMVVCEALCVGNFVIVEDGVVIGSKSMISHGCWIKKGAVVPPQSNLIPFAVYEGNPCMLVATLQEDAHVVLVRERQRQILSSLVIG
jgi:dynactin-5